MHKLSPDFLFFYCTLLFSDSVQKKQLRSILYSLLYSPLFWYSRSLSFSLSITSLFLLSHLLSSLYMYTLAFLSLLRFFSSPSRLSVVVSPALLFLFLSLINNPLFPPFPASFSIPSLLSLLLLSPYSPLLSYSTPVLSRSLFPSFFFLYFLSRLSALLSQKSSLKGTPLSLLNPPLSNAQIIPGFSLFLLHASFL